MDENGILFINDTTLVEIALEKISNKTIDEITADAYRQIIETLQQGDDYTICQKLVLKQVQLEVMLPST